MDIGIIGGADGPTHIYVSGPPIWQVIVEAVLIIVAVLALILFLKRRKK